MLKRSKDGRCEMLALEFVVVDGEFAKRKFWENWIIEGNDHAKAIEISRGTIKSVLDSALGLNPKDASPQARAARTKSLQGARRPDLHRQDWHREGHAEERRLGREAGRTRTFSRRSSRPTGGNGTRSCSPRPSTAAARQHPGPLCRPARRRQHPRRPSLARDGRHEGNVAHDRTGVAVRTRKSMAAARHRRRHRRGTWGRPSGRPHPARHANRTAAQMSNGAGSSPLFCLAGSERAPSRRRPSSWTPSAPSA